MPDFITKIKEDKQKYREQMARVEALPEDYQFVFEKMQHYMWSSASGSGLDMLQTQYDLIDLFEASAREGKQVLDVTGPDVAEFCDELIRDNKQWTDRLRKKLNQDMKDQLK
ncbi:MAG: DUF1048 domain-containing protein [Raoultibacter sp.]